MLYYKQVDKCWWAEALRTAVYLTNRILNTARSNITPFEVFWKQQPSLDHIRVFGSRGFMHVDKTLRTKWDSKAHKCMLLGYAEHSKAYRVWDFDPSRMATARTVTLDERPPSSVQTFVMYEYCYYAVGRRSRRGQ
ncbi:polyprotein [Phytophthora megakarya]|uniref:Polyprotein n=1 Tax=Phytophthora megakarya TaxID=4795 RepID=A0A225VXQ3_9STRA|nr:polyprotein [Phytophthora megakarya]